jgi:predicted HTH domain antitoxin
MGTIHVELAEELFSAADMKEGQPSKSASKLIALELFRERRVSAGKAAELAGVSLQEFLEFSADREVPLNYTMEDWESDQRTRQKLGS